MPLDKTEVAETFEKSLQHGAQNLIGEVAESVWGFFHKQAFFRSPIDAICLGCYVAYKSFFFQFTKSRKHAFFLALLPARELGNAPDVAKINGRHIEAFKLRLDLAAYFAFSAFECLSRHIVRQAAPF